MLPFWKKDTANITLYLNETVTMACCVTSANRQLALHTSPSLNFVDINGAEVTQANTVGLSTSATETKLRKNTLQNGKPTENNADLWTKTHIAVVTFLRLHRPSVELQSFRSGGQHAQLLASSFVNYIGQCCSHLSDCLCGAAVFWTHVCASVASRHVRRRVFCACNGFPHPSFSVWISIGLGVSLRLSGSICCE